MGDIVSFLLELNVLKELRYKLEINDKFLMIWKPKIIVDMQALNSMGMKKDIYIMQIYVNSFLH